MANHYEGNGQLRDEKTGRPLSKLASVARRAQFASDTTGVPRDEKQMIAMQFAAEDESPAVRHYILDITKLVREFDGPTIQLRQIIPLINEVVSRAQKDDPTLTDAEKRRVGEKGAQLISFINTKTSLATRIGAKLKNIAKGAVTSERREKIAESLSEGHGLIGKLAAKAMAPRNAKGSAEGFAKEMANTRATIYDQLFRASGGTPLSERRFEPRMELGSGFEDEDVASPVRKKAPKVARAPKATASKEGKTTAVGKGKTASIDHVVLDDILTTDQAILEQLKIQTNILRTSGESAEQLREAAERAANEGKGKASGPEGKSTSPKRDKKAPAAHSMLGDMMSGLKNAFLFGLGNFMATKGLGMIGDMVGGLKDIVMSGAKKALTFGAGEGGIGTLPGLGAIGAGAAVGGYVGENYIAPWAADNGNAAKRLYNRASDTFMYGAAEVGEKTGLFAKGTTKAAQTHEAALNRTIGGGDNISQSMHMSDAGLAKLQQREGFRREPYWDVNGWAIGFGDHTYKGVSLGSDRSKKPNITISDVDAKAMLKAHVAKEYEPVVKRQLKGNVNQQQFDALVSVAYNSPRAASRLASRVSKGESLSEADFTASGTVGGQKDKNLVNRRRAEFAQFVSGDRAAAPVMALTAAQDKGAPTVVAPTTVISRNDGGGNNGGIMIPSPMTTEDPNASVRAMRGVNAF